MRALDRPLASVLAHLVTWMQHGAILRGATGLGLAKKAWAKKAWVSAATAASLALGLGGCGPGVDPGANQNRTLANAICASPDTAAAIRDYIFASAEMQTAASNRLALTQLAKQAALRIDVPSLVNYDDLTRRTTCQGQLHLILPTGAVRNLGDSGDIVVDVKYTAQQGAEDAGMTYKVTGAENVISGVAAADISAWAARAQSSGMPAEAAPEPAVAASASPRSAAPAAPPGPVEMAKRPPTANLEAPPRAGYGPPPLPRCRWARSYADRTICGDPALEAEDRRIQRLFRAALAEDNTGEVRRTAQSEHFEREGCQDRDCIVQWFKQREADLSPR